MHVGFAGAMVSAETLPIAGETFSDKDLDFILYMRLHCNIAQQAFFYLNFLNQNLKKGRIAFTRARKDFNLELFVSLAKFLRILSVSIELFALHSACLMLC